MRRLTGFLAVSVLVASSVARAEVTSVSTRAQLSLTITPEERVCSGVFAPQPWRDASDPLFFATGSTARLDETELAANVLVPLASIHYVSGTLRIVLIGTPLQTQIQFDRLGWRPRWPFC
jgi:hypothetical protein